MDLNNYIRTVMDFPIEGIAFKDISPLLESVKAFEYTINKIIEENDFSKIDKIGGFDARGFLFGPTLAMKTKKPFFMIRKKGKLPGETISKNYGLEYGTDTIEILKNSVNKDDKVLLIDDLLATGGTAKAGCDLIEEVGGIVESIQFIIELNGLGGQEKLEKYNFKSLLKFD